MNNLFEKVEEDWESYSKTIKLSAGGRLLVWFFYEDVNTGAIDWMVYRWPKKGKTELVIREAKQAMTNKPTRRASITEAGALLFLAGKVFPEEPIVETLRGELALSFSRDARKKAHMREKLFGPGI